MNSTCIRAMVFSLFICAVSYAQSSVETRAYITREIVQVMNPVERTEFLGFFYIKDSSEIMFQTQQVNPLDHKTRVWIFPLNGIDVYTETDSYGTHLRARSRAGAKFQVQCQCSDGSVIDLPCANIVAAGNNPEKLQKLAKAFNHLIELVTGRKELF